MDWMTIRDKAAQAFHKYKYVLLVLALGFVLMSLPDAPVETEDKNTEETVSQQISTADALESILAQIEGVGRVQVLLTEAVGPETVYQTDEDSSGDSVRIETVIISGADRGEQGLVRRVDPPVYLGAVVVCQGADRPAIQLAVVEAVANATGISTDRITVLKMK